MRREVPGLRGKLRRGCLAALVVLAAGCDAQPISAPVEPYYVADAAQAQTDLYFLPGSSALARGEAARLRRFLQALALEPTDDVVVDVPWSGSTVLYKKRVQTARNAVGRVPARVRLINADEGFNSRTPRPDAGFVQVIRFGPLRIECRNNGLSANELANFTPLPPIGCANAINRAAMVASPRDLNAPRQLSAMPASTGVAAVQNYRDGTTKAPPFGIGSTSN